MNLPPKVVRQSNASFLEHKLSHKSVGQFDVSGLRCQVGQRRKCLNNQPAHSCNSSSIGCVQIRSGYNSAAAANSLTAGARVQKSWLMQEGPPAICCPMASSFDTGQVSLDITQKLSNPADSKFVFYTHLILIEV